MSMIEQTITMMKTAVSSIGSEKADTVVGGGAFESSTVGCGSPGSWVQQMYTRYMHDRTTAPRMSTTAVRVALVLG